MLRNQDNIAQSIDWLTVFLYAACVIIGLLNVYAAVYNPESQTKLFDLSNNAGKQVMFAGTSVLLIIAILVIDHKFWEAFAPIIYGLAILILLLTLVVATDIKGSRSWIRYGSFQVQPAEFMKIALSLMLAKFVSQSNVNLSKWRDMLSVAGLVLLPALLILASKETGLTLVFAAFVIVFYREGLPGIYPALLLTVIALLYCALFLPSSYILAGLAAVGLFVYFVIVPRYDRNRKTAFNLTFIFSLMAAFVVAIPFLINNVLQPHMRRRIQVLVDPNVDPTGIGWNVIQSKIAIGSGRLWGKGFLDGTQTKFDFVPEQHTDFIFCTIGEEHGFVGSAVVIFLFMALVFRLVSLAEKQRNRFARAYGYCVASILFFHFMVNIGITIGLVPVIGITLPFFSYGGSSLWTFSILLFIFLKLDAQRPFTLSRT